MEKHILTMADHWLKLLICLLVMNTQVQASHKVNITFLESAVEKGAVCLDGAPPAYYYDKGFGNGSNNWLIFLEGGGWCATTDFCPKYMRDKSTLEKPTTMDFDNMLSQTQNVNPDFYNWNKVYVTYCDGSSFMGDVENAYQIKGINITSRGARIFDVVMDDLLAKGMVNANNAILAGGSAGGLAAIMHCDGFRALIPNASRVKCISDSGFFVHVNERDLPGFEKRDRWFDGLVEFHELTKFLPKSCTSRMRPGLCVFPENVVGDIKTPLFLLESAFDSFQIKTGMADATYNETVWASCAENLNCTPPQLQSMKKFRSVFINTLQKIRNSPSRGMFVHSCVAHCHLISNQWWNPSYAVGNKIIAEAIGDWYFDRNSCQEIDTQDDTPQKCTIPA